MIKTNLKPKSTIVTRMEQEWVVIGEPNRVKPTKKIILNHFSTIAYDKKIIKNPFLITDTFDQDTSEEDFSGDDTSEEESSEESSFEESLEEEDSEFTTFQHQGLVKNTMDYWIGQSNDDHYKDNSSDDRYTRIIHLMIMQI